MAKIPDSNPQSRKLYNDSLAAESYETWWLCDKEDIGANMVQLIHAIEENQRDRKHMDLKHGFMYQNRNFSFQLGDFLGAASELPSRYNVTYNVTKSAVDTLTSKIAQNRPRPRILTEKGNYKQQQRAKKLTKYLDATLDACKTYRQGAQAFKDGAIFGTGVIKVIADHSCGEIKTERVLPTEIFVDEVEAAYGEPQTLYQTKLVSKISLLDQFPEHSEVISSSTPVPYAKHKTHSVEMIRVYEGWKLGNKDEKGRHVIAVDNGTLFEEEWAYECFPFAFFRFNSAIASFYGQGVIEELFGTQLEIDKLLRDIQRAQHLIAVPRVLVEYNSKVVASHLNNELGSAIKYRGMKPDFVNPTAMSNEIYNHVKWLIQSAYEKVGISQLSASSKKPTGLDSGKALREYKDTETERFATTVKQYEEFFEDIAELVILFSKELFQNNKNLKVKAESSKFIETISWKDVDLDKDKFILRIHSSSLFPTSPAAKLQKAEEYIRAGWMDREDAIRLLELPDMEAWESIETANRDLTEKIIGEILGEGKYSPPEPEMLLEKDIEIARKAYLEGKANGAEEENLELLLRWIEQASGMLPPASPPNVNPMMMQGPVAPQQGTPMPLPQSGLIPQV